MTEVAVDKNEGLFNSPINKWAAIISAKSSRGPARRRILRSALRLVPGTPPKTNMRLAAFGAASSHCNQHIPLGIDA